MKLYLPNGGILQLNTASTVTYKDRMYRVTETSTEKLLLDIVDGVVIIYNNFWHSYTPPKVPLSPDQIVQAIELEKLNPEVITSIRNKLNKYRVRTNTWRK